MRIVGLALFLISLPLFHSLMRGPLAYRRIGWSAIGLAPFVIGYLHLDVSIISWGFWPGYVKGMIVSLLDSLAIAILLTTRPTRGSKALLWAYIAFLAGSAVATLFASTWLPSFFFNWQLARMILVFAAVSRVAAHPEGTRQIIGGMALGIAFQALFSISQRASGVMQASGTLGHQNLLGMCTHFALLLSLATLLAGDRRKLPMIGVVGGIVAVMLTGSRATVGLAGGGAILLVVMSLLRWPTGFKMRMAGIGLAMIAAAAPVAYMTVHHRTGAALDSSNEERDAFERAAHAMWTDYPMGVGGNQYVVKANVEGYSQRAGVSWAGGSRATNVHNTYLLLGAETGYLGLISYITLLMLAITLSVRLAWVRPRDQNGDIALGAMVTLLVITAHCLYEWVFVTWPVQYLFAITLGIISGLSAQLQIVRNYQYRKEAASQTS